MPIVVSLFYFNRVNKYWDRQFQMILKEDVYKRQLHGRDVDIVDIVKKNRKVGVLMDLSLIHI